MPRGPRRFSFTYDEIAAVVGLKRKTVRNHAQGADAVFDPTDLYSLAAYVMERAHPSMGYEVVESEGVYPAIRPDGPDDDLDARVDTWLDEPVTIEE